MWFCLTASQSLTPADGSWAFQPKKKCKRNELNVWHVGFLRASQASVTSCEGWGPRDWYDGLVKLTVIVLLGALFYPLGDFPGRKDDRGGQKEASLHRKGRNGRAAPPRQRDAVALFHHCCSAPPVCKEAESEIKTSYFWGEPATLAALVVTSAPLLALRTNPSIQLDLFGHDIQQALSSHSLPMCSAPTDRNAIQKLCFAGGNLRRCVPLASKGIQSLPLDWFWGVHQSWLVRIWKTPPPFNGAVHPDPQTRPNRRPKAIKTDSWNEIFH